MAAGAILVQRTTWSNASRAVEALKQRQLLEPAALLQLEPAELGAIIQPAGFRNAKTDYLRAFARYFRDNGGESGLGLHSSDDLRRSLLSVRGIGPETADSILLYLFNRPVWIADTYAQRLLSRLSGQQHDHERQAQVLSHWIAAGRTTDLQELHALIVAHGKHHCRARPNCVKCPLLADCQFARDVAATATLR